MRILRTLKKSINAVTNILYSRLVYEIIGANIDVHEPAATYYDASEWEVRENVRIDIINAIIQKSGFARAGFLVSATNLA